MCIRDRLNNNNTEARIAGAVVEATGTTTVRAMSNADVGDKCGDLVCTNANTAVALGAGIQGSFNGAFAFFVSRSDTRAIIESGSRATEIKQGGSEQSVIVQAIDDVTLNQQVGGVSASVTVAAIGGALNWIDIQNNTDAHIGANSQVSASDDVTVDARSIKDITSRTAGAALGGVLGLAGSFTIASIGTVPSADAQTAQQGVNINDVRTAANAALRVLTSGQGTSRTETPQPILDKLDTNTATAGSNTVRTNGVNAFIDDNAVVTVGDDLSVNANETVTFDGLAGAAAVSASAGVGGSVTSVKLETPTRAFIA